MNEVIEQAQKVSRELTMYNRCEKASKELHQLKNDRGSLAMELLELTEEQIDRALDRANMSAKAYISELKHLLGKR